MNSKNSILHEESLSVIDSNEEILEFTDEKVELEIKKDSHKKSQKILNIMVVDDEKEVHDVTRMVLANYSFEDYQVKFIDAYSAKEAKEKLATAENLALILLDVVMEDDSSGLELVKYIREDLKNKFVRIILRTGQPGQAPEEEVITNYDINDYKSKIELTARKLYTTVTASLRNYRDLLLIEKHRSDIEEKSRINKLLLDALPCAALLINENGEILARNSQGFAQKLPADYRFDLKNIQISAPPWGKFPDKFNIYKPQNWESECRNRFFDNFWNPLEANKFLLYSFDITEKKKSEIEKKKYLKMFHQAQKMESIGILASGIAHDFNNILNVINGYVGLLALNLPQDSEERAKISSVFEAVGVGAKLTRRLLALSQKEREEFFEIDFHEVLNDAVHLLTPNCKNLTIKTDLLAEKVTIFGEKNLLQNAIINLGLNAKDAMPEGGKLTFTTSSVYLSEEEAQKYPQKFKPGDYIKIEVMDTGIGISHENLDRIFEPLFTTKETGKGSGLGLAGVFSCVQRHKGILEVESKVGKGTTFTILLPVKKLTEDL